MVWNSDWPVGTQSVKTNRPTGLENTVYTETMMNVDHYWNISGEKDGHHQFVQMPMTGTSAVPDDAALPNGMDGVLFAKAKSSAEVNAGNQDVQLFFKDNTAVGTPGFTQVMQVLGIRAMAHFSMVGNVITTNYVYNIKPSTVVLPEVPGIAFVNTGRYKITFENELPSNNYTVLGGALSKLGTLANVMSFGVQSTAGGIASTVKCSTFFTAGTLNSSNTLETPLQCYFICFGG